MAKASACTGMTPREIKNIRKDICKVFSENGLKITIKAHKKIINFLETTLNLNNKTYTPYTKPNSSTKYINNKSKHPATYNHRNLLNQSGYKHQLQFRPRTQYEI